MTADDGSGARLEIAGYASVFDSEDYAGDIIRPGADPDAVAAQIVERGLLGYDSE